MATFGGDQSAFIREHKLQTSKPLRKTSKASVNGGGGGGGGESGSQQELTTILNAASQQRGHDPLKVTDLDIDSGSYSPTPEKMDFLKKALSVSHDPFLSEAKRDRAASFNATRDRSASLKAAAK